MVFMIPIQSGKTAIQIAQENKHDKVVDLLSPEVDSESTSGTTEPGEPDNQVEESKQVSARSSRPRIRKILLRIPWPQRKKRNKLVCKYCSIPGKHNNQNFNPLSTYWDTYWEATILKYGKLRLEIVMQAEAAKIGSEAEVRKLLDEGENPDSHEDNKV